MCAVADALAWLISAPAGPKFLKSRSVVHCRMALFLPAHLCGIGRCNGAIAMKR
jgi:hypothetical protein